MSDLSSNLQIPPDPEGHSGDVHPDTTWDQAVEKTIEDVSEVVTVPTVNTPVPPSVYMDSSGVPHAVIPLTKKTKAFVGTSAAVAGIIATNLAVMLPDGPTKTYIVAGVGVLGAICTWLGIVIPTNLPKRSDKV